MLEEQITVIRCVRLNEASVVVAGLHDELGSAIIKCCFAASQHTPQEGYISDVFFIIRWWHVA